MKVNAVNLLRQASDCIEHRRKDDGAYAFMLSELSQHLADVRDGKHTWEEFAEAYCLTIRDRVPEPTRCGCKKPATAEYEGEPMCEACATYCARRDFEEGEMPGGFA